MDIAGSSYTTNGTRRELPATYNVSKRTNQARAANPIPVDKQSDLFKVCMDFEALFLKQMLNSMRKTINRTDFMNGGFAEEIYEDMLYDKYAEKMAKSAGFGIADTLYLQLAGKK